jgi:hypothetical protein
MNVTEIEIEKEDSEICSEFIVSLEESASTLTQGPFGKFSEGHGKLYGGGF